jgi:pyrimidine operon attenuation protein/uracil phosphoribosyltransferase
MQNLESQILSKKKVVQKVRRMAFEIYENNFEEHEIAIAGIDSMGYIFAQLLSEEIQKISSLKIELIKINLDKKSPVQGEVSLDSTPNINGKVLILVDDVLNTGKTLAHSLQAFLKTPLKKIQIAILVDRNHRSFPISADFIGYSLSTTVKEHVEVVLDDETKFGVYLY